MSALVAVDWGTSSLRGALLDVQGRVQAERAMDRGILSVAPGAFAAVFDECFGDWMTQAPLALISGMAGSRQGWIEAPYCACPSGFDDLGRHLAWVRPQRVAIVPGLACERDGVPDVMRGEETQVFGALRLLGLQDATLVLPGTHSKWVSVAQGRITAFTTYMTGEVYALLRRHSILARTLPADDAPLDEYAFTQGLRHARRSGGLLDAAFSARTLALFDRMAAGPLESYLSGLVIGEEMRAREVGGGDEVDDPADGAGDAGDASVVVIASQALARRYALALPGVRCVGDQAAWHGLWSIAQSIAQSPA